MVSGHWLRQDLVNLQKGTGDGESASILYADAACIHFFLCTLLRLINRPIND
jgi:hypothetical protein